MSTCLLKELLKGCMAYERTLVLSNSLAARLHEVNRIDVYVQLNTHGLLTDTLDQFVDKLTEAVGTITFDKQMPSILALDSGEGCAARAQQVEMISIDTVFLLDY